MLAISPARIQIIQAGQNEPSILTIGSQAVKKTAKTAGIPIFHMLGKNVCQGWELNLNNVLKYI
jgi:hypothetical protein